MGAEVPWAFRLLVLLVFAFVAGGLYLDYLAASVSYPDFLDSREVRTDPKTGEEIRIDKAGLRTEDRQLIVDLAKAKAQRLNDSAKLLYDFAKIVLGALIASLSQLISAQRRLPPSEPDVESKPAP